MRILLDNGIFIHSEFARSAVKQTSERWGGAQLPAVYGLIRKAPDKNIDYQRQKEALFTVGRLIREGRIEAFEYWEIECEKFRGTPTVREFNALRDCVIHKCDPAIQRSRFRSSTNLTDVFSKGGKKDIKKGISPGQANQIVFLEWLVSLTPSQVDFISSNGQTIGLPQFEIDSFRDIGWFKSLCRWSGNRENYPDFFHLWTAKRNELDALLTLDNTLTKLVSRIKNEKSGRVRISVDVLQPLDLLKKLGIDKPDPVPMEIDRFYHLHELP